MQLQRTRLASATVSRTTTTGATRILIVDQDRQVGVALSFMLSGRRFDEVRTVRSVRRAIAVAEQFRPEIVFLELELPDDGLAVIARSLSHDGRKPRARLIALSTDAEHPMRDQARSAGVERFLVKPVSQEDMDKVLGTGRTT